MVDAMPPYRYFLAQLITDLGEPVEIPTAWGSCHFEAEMTVLIGQPLTRCSEQQAADAIAGVGIALDLTLRDLQAELKQKSLPWEKAKAFDGACPVSAFVTLPTAELQNQQIRLHQNGHLKQDGNSADMITPVLQLLAYISQFFTLQPGDIVLTGTPAGVGPLAAGDELQLNLSTKLNLTTHIFLVFQWLRQIHYLLYSFFLHYHQKVQLGKVRFQLL